jgi:hypothetical protein
MKMADKKIQTQPVQGFKVDSFLVKKDEIKLVLKASKDEVRAGAFNLGDVLSMLELHSTSDYTVELSLVSEETGE